MRLNTSPSRVSPALSEPVLEPPSTDRMLAERHADLAMQWRDPAPQRLAFDSLARDESLKLPAHSIASHLIQGPGPHTPLPAYNATMNWVHDELAQAYEASPTFRRLFNHAYQDRLWDENTHVLLNAEASLVDDWVTLEEPDASDYWEDPPAFEESRDFFEDTEPLPASRFYSSDEGPIRLGRERALMHEVVRVLTRLQPQETLGDGFEHPRGALVEYTNIILKEMGYREPAQTSARWSPELPAAHQAALLAPPALPLPASKPDSASVILPATPTRKRRANISGNTNKQPRLPLQDTAPPQDERPGTPAKKQRTHVKSSATERPLPVRQNTRTDVASPNAASLALTPLQAQPRDQSFSRSALAKTVSLWYPHPDSTRDACWTDFSTEPSAPAFTEYLDRLDNAVSSLNDHTFKTRISAWLTELSQHPDLRAETFQIALNIEPLGSQTSVVILFYEHMKQLQTQHRITRGEYDRRPDQVVKLARGLFRLKMLKAFTGTRSSALQLGPTELVMAYQVQLRERLNLPLDITCLGQLDTSCVTPADLRKATVWVLEHERKLFEPFLLKWIGWQTLQHRLEMIEPTTRLQQLADVVEHIRQPGSWNHESGDLAVNLLTQLPSWPQNRHLRIHENTQHGPRAITLSAPQTAEADATSHTPSQPLHLRRLDQAHYELLKKPSPTSPFRTIPIDADGDCFYRAVLIGLSPVERAGLLGLANPSATTRNSVTPEHIQQLRNLVADHIEAHAEDILPYIQSPPLSPANSPEAPTAEPAPTPTADPANPELQITRL